MREQLALLPHLYVQPLVVLDRPLAPPACGLASGLLASSAAAGGLPTRGLAPRGLPRDRLLPTSRLAPCRLLAAHRLLAARRRLAASRGLAPCGLALASTTTRHLRAADVAVLVDEVEEPVLALHLGPGDLLSTALPSATSAASHRHARDVALLVEVVQVTRLPLDAGTCNLCCHSLPPIRHRRLYRRRPLVSRETVGKLCKLVSVFKHFGRKNPAGTAGSGARRRR